MKKLISLMVLVLISSNAFAARGTEVGAFFGMKNTNFDSDVSTIDIDSKAGLMGGVIAYGEMGGFLFRTGGYYTERKAEVSVPLLALSADFKAAYVDVPVTLMYSFNDMFSAFGGALVALKLSDSCSGDASVCDAFSDDISSFHTALTFGLNARFHPNWSGELFYEHGLNELADDVGATAISAALVFIY